MNKQRYGAVKLEKTTIPCGLNILCNTKTQRTKTVCTFALAAADEIFVKTAYKPLPFLPQEKSW